MNYKEFAKRIKEKYPAYADMDDKILARKMVDRYPEYSDITFEEPKGILRKGLDFVYTTPKEKAPIVREFLAEKIAPTESQIMEKAKETGGVPYFSIARNIAAKGISELLVPTPTDVVSYGALGAGSKYLPKILPEIVVPGIKTVKKISPSLAKFLTKSVQLARTPIGAGAN